MAFKPRILVAEDDAAIRDLIRAQLSDAGYDVHTAANGNEAVRKIMGAKPDAVVLDINMPVLDGFGVLRELKAHLAGVRIPILVLTARHGEEDVLKALSLGAKDYLTKPFSESQLLGRIARLLRPRVRAPNEVAI